MRAVEVFTPGKAPSVTFVNTHLSSRQQHLLDALEQGGMLVSISGPSKSGKTVFVKSVVGNENLIDVTASGITDADGLWKRVLHRIGTPIPSGTADTEGATKQTGASLDASVMPGGMGVKGQRTTTQIESSTKAVQHAVIIDYHQILIDELTDSGMVVFIDDFHYMGPDLQRQVATQIKDAIEKGVSIVCAAVTYHSEDVLRANSDLRGRIVHIDFDYWDVPTLQEIGLLGFPALNMEVDHSEIRAFAEEAAGSPQLMQAICLNFCFEKGHRERTRSSISFPSDRVFFRNVCMRTAVNTDYSSTVEKLREGPKTRGTDRIQHLLKDNTSGDVYSIILKAIALDPPSLHFRYSVLTERIRGLCAKAPPVGSSVTGACLQIATLANDAQANVIIEWDAVEDVLNIRDPYLLFYIRWSGALQS